MVYAVNQRIPNALELRELFYCGAIRGYQMRGKIPFDPHSFEIIRKGTERCLKGKLRL